MEYQTLSIELPQPSVAVVHLKRPEAANALNIQMALELKDIFDNLVHDRQANAVILTGDGRHFCAGADLKERQGMDEDAWRAQHDAFEAAFRAMLDCPVPVIAAVNGAAYGGGLELALGCDFIYAARDAKFALTEVTLGIMPGLGGTQTLPRAVGAPRAKELIFCGLPFTAQEAYEWGMVNKLCAAKSLLKETLATARIISDNAPLSVRAVKKSIGQGIALTLPEALNCELSHYNKLLTTRDRHEGIRAWREKRKAAFTGE